MTAGRVRIFRTRPALRVLPRKEETRKGAKPFGKKFSGGKEILAFSVVFCYTEYIGNRGL